MAWPVCAPGPLVGHREQGFGRIQLEKALPLQTIMGLELGLLLTGAVLTETVFSWPGLGRFIYEAILARDTPVIMGAFIVMSFTVMVASLVTDLIYAALDPRVSL